MGFTTSTRRAAKSVTMTTHVDANRVQGSHVFKISRYSLHRKRFDAGALDSANQSSFFTVGGYDCQLVVFPAGIHQSCKEYYVAASLFLESSSGSNNAKPVRASAQFSLLDVAGSFPPCTMTTETTEFDSGTGGCTDLAEFMKRSELEASPYLHKDRLTIKCTITIFKSVAAEVKVPPPNITEHLRNLLHGRENADVIFEVGGEDFPAHRTVLAMRSPVFRAELFGAMREKDMTRIIIGDMQPAVFDALLHFIYTDSLPDMDDLVRDDYIETIRHLLVAADRYAMARLKVMCESILSKNIDAKTVMTTLALADQHSCGRLNDACVHFISSLDITKELGDVMSSQEHAELKSTCPLALVELWEKKCSLEKSKA